MAKRLDENLGSVGFDNLINGLTPGAEVFHVQLAAGQGILKRGTLLAKSSGSAGDGKLVIFGTTAATNEPLTADCVLAEDVPVGTSADEPALVFITGNFNEDALILATGASLTEADRDALRIRGILLGASENEVVTA